MALKKIGKRRSRFALRENQQRAERAEAEVRRLKEAFALLEVTHLAVLQAWGQRVQGV